MQKLCQSFNTVWLHNGGGKSILRRGMVKDGDGTTTHT